MSPNPRNTAAATLLALAFAAPTATARPLIDPPLNPPPRPTPAPSVRAADEGFDWGSAGLGAAVTGGLVLVATGGFTAARRARTRPAS
jgi:hypothetical protein